VVCISVELCAVADVYSGVPESLEFKHPRNSEVLPKLARIPSSVVHNS
jgi:hypothetical protein